MPPPDTAAAIAAATAEVLNPDAPLDSRIRALYVLKPHRTAETVAVLHQAIRLTTSVLFQHEIIYNIGQFGFASSFPTLIGVIHDHTFDVVSRHEAIEAIGAICDLSDASREASEVLRSVADDASEPAPIRESCELALQRMELASKVGGKAKLQSAAHEFTSVDPAPAFETTDKAPQSVEALEGVLSNASLPLFQRYRAMFSLRDMNTPESVQALCRWLRQDKSSCLFRHEIAFVLGQLEKDASVDALTASLQDEGEHEMVRHESAEALGAIANPATWAVLQQYAVHKSQLVADSCAVALEMHAYWSKFRPAEHH